MQCKLQTANCALMVAPRYSGRVHGVGAHQVGYLIHTHCVAHRHGTLHLRHFRMANPSGHAVLVLVGQRGGYRVRSGS